MRSLSKLFFDFPMNIKILLKMAHLFDQLFIFKHQFLWLFWLEFQLASQLMVLQNCQTCRSVKLFFFQRKQVRSHILYFCQHFISQSINSLNFFSLLVSNLFDPFLLFSLDIFLQIWVLVVHFISFAHVDIVFFKLQLQLNNFILCNSSVLLKLSISHSLLLPFIKTLLLPSRSRSLMRFSRVIFAT